MVLSLVDCTIAVVGASGNTGAPLVERLVRGGAKVIAISRTPDRLAQLAHPNVEIRPVDAGGDAGLLRAALKDASVVINVAHARYTRALIGALANPGVRLITLGSTRIFTRFPDTKAAEVSDALTAHAGAVNGVILHPTMIYGGADNNIRRIIRFVRRIPVVPLPQGGRALLQPIHRDDVVECLIAAINKDTGREPVIIAGAEALPYSEIIRACGRAIGKHIWIAPLPLWAMLMLAKLTRFLPGIPEIEPDEVRRLCEDKAFDISWMRTRLGVTPVSFAQGLARMTHAGEVS